MSDEKTYNLRYKLEPGEFTLADIDNSVEGLADAALVASILYHPDGALDVAFFHGDGRNRGPLSPATQYQVWALLAADLAEDEDVPHEEREIARRAFESVRELVLKRRAAPQVQPACKCHLVPDDPVGTLVRCECGREWRTRINAEGWNGIAVIE